MREEKEAKVKIGKKKYKLVSDDDYLQQITNDFEPHMVELFRSLLRSEDCVLDVGANIGCTSILFGELASKVYSFEPSPTTYAFLKKNISSSALKNVELLNIGLGAEPGKSTLTFAPSSRSGGFVSNQTRASAGHVIESIEIQTIDEIVRSLDLPTVDFIKIDVEGFEANVIKGAQSTIAASRPIVVLELNHWCLNAFQRTSIPDFFDFLRSTFPILLAVDEKSYLNLHDEGESYAVMYHHINHSRFPNIVAAFDQNRLDTFYMQFTPGYLP